MSYTVTPYHPGDHEALREVCIRTGDAGEDAMDKYFRPELLPLIYLDPYVIYEPSLAFVLRRDADQQAVGYVIGTADSRRFEAQLDREWWPALQQAYLPGSTPDGYWGEALIRKIHEPDRASAGIVEDYPAHLHIDLMPEGQGKGYGRAIMTRFLDELRSRDVPGVHLGVGVRNTRAIGYYEHLGFENLVATDTVRLMGMRL